MPVEVSTVLVDAAVEVSAARWGGTLEPGIAAGLLRKLNRIIDLWNANPLSSFTVGFNQYTPTLGQDSQTIGPTSADFSVDPRPTRILAANVVINTSTPSVRSTITIRDSIWFENLSVPELEAAFPTDLYYDPSFGTDGNGRIYLYPVPTVAYPIELKTDQRFAGYVASDTLWLPPGYLELLTLELAVKAANSLGQMVTSDLRKNYLDAKTTVFGNNVETRNARTRDGGMPGGRRGRDYLYQTGLNKGQ